MASDLSWLLSAIGFAVAISGTPGPNNVMVASSGATFGFVRTLPHIIGISIGFPVMLLLVAIGAAEPLRTYPVLQIGLRWVGAIYLLWLAWHIARAAPTGVDRTARSRPLGMMQAALFQWVNPKAWVAAAGAIVTYTDGRTITPALIMGAIFLVASFGAVALWTVIGAGAGRMLRSPQALRRFNVGMALLLAASVVPMLLE
jgi:threonine/homoserine/homoserine lactone efflux protein